MDAHRVIKQAKEGWAFPDRDILCRSCLNPVFVYGQDLNGDPIFDPVCPTCVAKIIMRRAKAAVPEPAQVVPEPLRQHCNRCYDAKPILGMAWCGPCAIAYNETFRGKDDDALIDARARGFRDRMVRPGPG